MEGTLRESEPQGSVDGGSPYADRSEDRWLAKLVGPIGSDSLGRYRGSRIMDDDGGDAMVA